MSSKIKPVLHYDFEHFTEDDKVEDLSGNGYHGTVVGATRCEDMWGNPNSAMSFDGVDDYIDAGIINFEEFTICATVSVSNWGDRDIVGKDQSLLLRLSNGSPGHYQLITKPGWTFSSYSSSRIDDTIWRNLVTTFDSDYVGKVYENGILDINSQLVGPLAQNENHLFIGARTTESEFLSGVLSEIKVYDQALTPTQVKHISTQMMRKIGRQ
jgi:hypothetical protein